MLLELESIATPALWAGFVTFAIGMLVLDLVVFHRQAHETTVREALLWTVVWFCLSLLFNLGVLLCFGWDPARTFLTGYLIEKALSVDNILVFGAVFSSLGVPARLQRRVLIWGIFGALVMRGIFVMAGAALLHQFQWVSYLFGAFLVFTSIKLLRRDTVAASPGSNPIFRLFRRLVPYMEDYRDDRFITVIGNKRYATPLLLVLVAIETTDVVFALDSVPAIFAVTKDPFIVYTSNIFAMFGLRALYFVLAGMIGNFHYLKVALSLMLAFVGAKMLVADIYAVPISAMLIVIATVLIAGAAASLLRPQGLPRSRTES